MYVYATGGTTSASKFVLDKTACFKCHNVNLDTNSDKWVKEYGLIFNHDVHLKEGFGCEACHNREPHEKGVTHRVHMDLCYNCHGLSHGRQGVMAPYKCEDCHPPEFDLKPAYHKEAGFFPGEHIRKAKENAKHCYTCHAQTFCVECHIARNALPSSHKAINWLQAHGELPGFKMRSDCYYCHDDAFCAKCHKTPMPHNVFFIGTHGPEGKTAKPDCLICHKKVEFCSDCHHEPGLALDYKTCARCHKDLNTTMEKKTASLIFRHAPHTKFTCTDCHDAKKPTASLKMPMHDCYGAKCHGLVKADAPGECEVCHPKEFPLVPAKGSMYGDHSAANFLRRNHADLAEKDLSKCQICHPQKFCDDCHGMAIPHPAEFAKKHKDEAQKLAAKCVYCHTQYKPSFCDDCHHTGYDKAWGPFASTGHPPLVKEQGAEPCFKCHGPTYCAHCHVRGTKYPTIKGP